MIVMRRYEEMPDDVLLEATEAAFAKIAREDGIVPQERKSPNVDDSVLEVAKDLPVEKLKYGKAEELPPDEIDWEIIAEVWSEVALELGIPPKKRRTPEKVAAERDES